MELDLAYLCKEVREIARASATFLKEERRPELSGGKKCS